MSFFSKNRIKLFLVLFFVLVSVFGKVNNVYAQFNPEEQGSAAATQDAYDKRVKEQQDAEAEAKRLQEIANNNKATEQQKAEAAAAAAKAKAAAERTSDSEQKADAAAAEAAERNNPPIVASETCNPGVIIGDHYFSSACLRYYIAVILGKFIWVLSAATWVVAMIFTWVIDASINSTQSFAQMDIIINTWKILRDMVNMFALLIMLYIAIGTILQLDGVNWKKMISQMIIAIILINFSMAITGFVIDTTNVFAVYFYDKAKGGPDGNLSTQIFEKLNIAEQIKAGELAAQAGDVFANESTKVPSLGSTIINSLGTVVFMLVFIFVLATASILFIVRIVSLIFALIVSPLPWVAMIVPKYGSKIDSGYWQSLMNQALFAPVFMFCIYLTTRIIACGDMIKTLNKDNIGIPLFGGTMNALFFNVIIIGFLVGSILAAKKMGAAGAGGAEKFGKWATGAVVAGVGAAAGYAGSGIKRVDSALGGYGAAGAGRVAGAASTISSSVGSIGVGGYTVGGAVKGAAKFVDKQSGGVASSAIKNPMSALSSALKTGTGFDILPGSKSAKDLASEKKQQGIDDAIELINSHENITVAAGSAEETAIKDAFKLIKGDDILKVNGTVWANTSVAKWASADHHKTVSEKGVDEAGYAPSVIDDMENSLNQADRRLNRSAKSVVEGKLANKSIKNLIPSDYNAAYNIINDFADTKSIQKLNNNIVTDEKLFEKFNKSQLAALSMSDKVNDSDLIAIKSKLIANASVPQKVKDWLDKDREWSKY